MSSGHRNDVSTSKYRQGKSYPKACGTTSDSSHKVIAGKKPTGGREPKSKNGEFAKPGKSRPPDITPPLLATATFPWLLNGDSHSFIQQSGKQVDKDGSSKKRGSSSPHKISDGLMNGSALNGSPGKAHGIFFPQFSMMPLVSPMHYPPQFPEVNSRKRSQGGESKDLVNKISAILAAAPALRPAEKSQKMGNSMSFSTSQLQEPLAKKGNEKKSGGSVAKMTNGRKSEKSKQPTLLPNVSESLKAQVAQFVSSSPFSLTGTNSLFMPQQQIVNGYVPILPNMMFPTRHMTSPIRKSPLPQVSAGMSRPSIESETTEIKSHKKQKNESAPPKPQNCAKTVREICPPKVLETALDETIRATKQKSYKKTAPSQSHLVSAESKSRRSGIQLHPENLSKSASKNVVNKKSTLYQASQISTKHAQINLGSSETFSAQPNRNLSPRPPQNLMTSTNDDLDQLLSCVQSKITQEFGSSSGILSPNVMSPQPVSIGSALSSSTSDPLPSPEIPEHPLPEAKITFNRCKDFSGEPQTSPPKEVLVCLKNIRKKMKSRLVDLAVQEDIISMTEYFSTRLWLTSESERQREKIPEPVIRVISAVETNGVATRESAQVLPFKKRQYKSVPSPKVREMLEVPAKESAATGNEKPAVVAAGPPQKSVAGTAGTLEKSPRLPSKSKPVALTTFSGHGSGETEKSLEQPIPQRTQGAPKEASQNGAQNLSNGAGRDAAVKHRKGSSRRLKEPAFHAPPSLANDYDKHVSNSERFPKETPLPTDHVAKDKNHQCLDDTLTPIVSHNSTPPREKSHSLKIILKKPKKDSPHLMICSSPQSTISIASSSPGPVSPHNSTSKKRKSDSPLTLSVKRVALSEDVRVPVGDFGLLSNIYPDPKIHKPVKDKDLHECECHAPRGDQLSKPVCGDECLCRMLFIECDPEQCPGGSACTNQVIQKRQWAGGLEVFQTEMKGRGVRSKELLKAGTFVCEYVGEVISAESFYNRMSGEYKECPHHYCLKLDGATVIDAYRCGNIARFINHSCAPNSQVEKWIVNGQYRMAVFAFKDIQPDEEITYDYNFDSYLLQQKCCCGTKSCRGTIGSKKQKLSGLLMKKKLPVEPINGIMNPVIETVEHAKAATDPVKVISAVPPLARTIADVSPHIVTDSMDKVPRPSASGVHCRNTEKRLVLDQRIYLPRNIRRIDERGLNPEFKRAKPGVQFLPSRFPKLTLEALSELRSKPSSVVGCKPNLPVSSGIKHPTAYYIPVHWEPSTVEIAKYTQEEKEEVIRCICNVYLEEGTMIECDKCKSWQHNECMGILPLTEHYLCERCKPRTTPVEIHQNLPAASNPDCLDLYVTLISPNCQKFQVRVGDCVYLTPDRSPPKPDTFYDPWTLDILKIDKMFIGNDGIKFAFGYHYLWPHEVVHEASRSFFHTELIFSPGHHETVKLEAVLGRCCIMDYATYVKGKPREYPLEHCFICELKYTKVTKNFVKVPAREKMAVNLNKFCFETYRERLQIRRTYKPHSVPILKKKMKADAARRKSDQPPAIIQLVKEKCEHLQNIVERLVYRNIDASTSAHIIATL